jgi:hypothetical protein
MYKNTKEWLINELIKMDDDDSCITRNSIVWKQVAGFRQCGCIFAIYQNDYTYCVHSADDWKENEEPNMGYYDKSLTYDELIEKIANRYDEIRKKL